MKKSNAELLDQEIPLVRAAFAAPFRDVMLRNGVNADAWFRKVRLPAAKLADPSSLLPLKPFFHLANQVAIGENIPDYGMQVAQAKPWFEIDTMKPYLEKEPDLNSMLARFCQMGASQSSIVSFALTIDGDTCRFEYRNQPLIRNDIQMELYRATCMIELVQVFTGNAWRPQSVELRMPENQVARSNAILKDIELVFGSRHMAICFPADILGTSRSVSKTDQFRPATADDNWRSLADKTDVITALKHVLDNYILEPGLSIEMFADIVGLTPRSLQRTLQQHDSSFRQLVNDARKRYALRQLESNRFGVSDVSRQLGYSDASHFTRAFKSWTGLSPSDYRQQADSRARVCKIPAAS